MSALDKILEARGETRADYQAANSRGAFSNMMKREGVAESPSLARVLRLPRRPMATEELQRMLSQNLRIRPYDDDGEENLLRLPQVEALTELYDVRGLFAPMRVGSGKTLVTLLASTLLGVQRPVLMVPASLRTKTRKEFAAYRRNWRVRLPELVSYEEMGRPDREDKLTRKAPDLLMLDEAQRAKNLDAASTRRIERCIAQFNPVVGCLSGTLITDKLMDYWHLLVWALREAAPVPLQQAEAERWAAALDKDVGAFKRIGKGALENIPGGFHEWMRGSRGVVPTPGSDCDAEIRMSVWTPYTPPALRQVIQQTELTSTRPDGELLDEWELPDCLCQLALGFYYVWDPMPPRWWLQPRRAWLGYVRAILDERLPEFDSPSQIVNALDAKKPVPGAAEGAHLLATWREVRDKFVPNPVPVWLTSEVLEQVVQQATHGQLIWVKYRAAGHALQRLGIPYYPGGTDPQSAPPGQPIALSIAAHSTGRNMQAWHKSLVLSPMANAGAWEQLIGREHRAGQKSPIVFCAVIGTIDYHGAVLSRVVKSAQATSKASGFSQKLVDARWE